MTEQEAMEIIMQVAYDGEFPINSNEAFGIACKCMEKQIPKKIKVVNSIRHYCPSCDLYFDSRDWKSKYCGRCGQSLKWE